MKNVMFKSMMLIGMLAFSSAMSAEVKSDHHHGQYNHQMYQGHSQKHQDCHHHDHAVLHIKHTKHCLHEMNKRHHDRKCKCECHYMMQHNHKKGQVVVVMNGRR